MVSRVSEYNSTVDSQHIFGAKINTKIISPDIKWDYSEICFFFKTYIVGVLNGAVIALGKALFSS